VGRAVDDREDTRHEDTRHIYPPEWTQVRLKEGAIKGS